MVSKAFVEELLWTYVSWDLVVIKSLVLSVIYTDLSTIYATNSLPYK